MITILLDYLIYSVIIIIILGLLKILKTALIPLYYIKNYEKKFKNTLSFYYNPICGLFFQMLEHQSKNNDVSYVQKRIIAENKNTDAIMTTFLGQPCFLGIKKEFIKEVFQQEQYLAKSMLEFGYHELINNGLLYSSGKEWKNQRAIVSQVFHYQKLLDRVPVIDQLTDEVIKNLEKYYNTKELVNINQECGHLTAGLIERTFFSEDFKNVQINGRSLSQELTDVYQVTFAHNTSSIYTQLKNLFLGKYAASTQFLYSKKEKELYKRIIKIKEKCQQIINKRFDNYDKDQNKNYDDFLNLFVKLCKEGKYKKENIIGQFLTFYNAGTDTTAIFLSTLFYILSQNVEIQEKLRQELKNCTTSQEIFQNNYLNCVVKEVLRHSQSLTIQMPRQVQKDITILGKYKIQKGWYITSSLQAEMYNPEVYPDPFTFKPERWINEKGEKIEFDNYFPFSSGPRNCIGQHMAIMEIKIMAAKSLKNFKICLGNKEQQTYTMQPFYQTINQKLVYLEKL